MYDNTTRRKSISELRSELEDMRAEARAIVSRSDDELSGIDAERFEVLADQIERHKADIDAAQRSIDSVRELATKGYTEAGTPFTTQRSANPERDMAMRSLDSATDSGRLLPESAETVQRMIETGSSHSRSWSARWAAAAGDPAYERAFGKLLADSNRGHLTWTPEESAAYRAVTELANEQRAMGIGSTAAGHAMVPMALDPAIILTNDGVANPLRQISRVVTIATDSWHGVTSAGASAEWTAEAAEMADGSPTLAQPDIPVHKADVFVPYSFELEGDGAGFIQELRTVIVDAANNLTAEAYTTGNGTGKPTGIITALAGTSSVVLGAGSEALTAADIYALQNALPPRFQANAQWTANLSTINGIRQFETTNGALKFPEAHSNPPLLLGRALNENSNMQGTINTAATADNHVLLYGDYKQFVIVDRVGATVEIAQHLFGPNRRPTGQRGMILWLRTGSDVVAPEAFRLLNVPTTA
ncbi:phage major capsid protein [Nocardia cyriacigeorgica]|uniref:Predicted phage phi-C31 gp36 major capsid-like protein n=1 Tax=Nocardia cyriacigeorgica TaxID=135487 RepID=A0A4U8WHI5_9NOCA|nr:phage major capsid protein [Nocardia cyriacigeorgica]VFB01489.1 Predicted phage phi-C31 gp36 major capsid-like protein [Nocardia cyriacigeorgica]